MNYLKLSKLNTLIRLPFTFLYLFQCVKRQKKFIKSNLSDDLQKFRSQNDGSLDRHDFYKITNYYSLGVPAVLGEVFCLLRGKKMTLKERMAGTYQGAMTGLFDDFFDRKDKPLVEILKIIDNPYQYEGINSNEQLFLHFYRKMFENIDNPDFTKKTLFDVYEAQIQSQKQYDQSINAEELKDITLQKGSVSLLFYRSAFSHDLDKAERNMLIHMGGLMQLGNDIFDVYKDNQANIDTMVTTAKRIEHIRFLFSELLNEFFTLADRTNYKKKNINKFKRMISLSISRCFVCLDQLEKLEKSTENAFSPSKYTRKELICDMEKPVNVFKSMYYHIVFCN